MRYCFCPVFRHARASASEQSGRRGTSSRQVNRTAVCSTMAPNAARHGRRRGASKGGSSASATGRFVEPKEVIGGYAVFECGQGGHLAWARGIHATHQKDLFPRMEGTLASFARSRRRGH